MPKEFSRHERVATRIQREIATLLSVKIRDPRLHDVVITDVEISSDLAHATIYFSVSLADDEIEAMLVQINQAWKKAQGFMRSSLAHSLEMRTVPQLHFSYDASQKYGNHLDDLINKALYSDR